jgi:hypothetical protein
VSLTVTVNVHVAAVPVEQLTVVVPTGKNEPEAGEQVITPHSPVDVGAGYSTTAPHWPVVLPTVIFAGQVIVQTAITCTVKEQVAVLPDASVAVQLTVVVPSGKQVPDAGVQETVTPGQLSFAVGAG